jgi:hypothetical protein
VWAWRGRDEAAPPTGVDCMARAPSELGGGPSSAGLGATAGEVKEIREASHENRRQSCAGVWCPGRMMPMQRPMCQVVEMD